MRLLQVTQRQVCRAERAVAVEFLAEWCRLQPGVIKIVAGPENIAMAGIYRRHQSLVFVIKIR